MALLSSLPAGSKGIDTIHHFASKDEATRLAQATNSTFFCRYIARTAALETAASGNLDAAEITNILDAGLKLLIVQRAPQYASDYTVDNATAWGTYAAERANALLVPSGARIFCDLEGVGSGFKSVDWVQAWVTALKNRSQQLGTSYIAGLYYGTGVTAQDVQSLMSGGWTTATWAAYSSAVPKNIGENMDQGPGDQPVSGFTFTVDYDTVLKQISSVLSRT